jgi:pyridoxal phosphate enzyme (YggS family)
VQQEIAETADRVGRRDEVRLVAVTKTFPADIVRQAYDAGQRLFGENRVQEAADKIDALSGLPELEWHLIGHLQTNKARQAAECFSMVESVDSVRLATALDGRAARIDRVLPVLLEVNVSGESSKSGFDPDALPGAVEEIAALDHLEIRGLMTVAPLVEDAEDTRPVFRRLRELRDDMRERYRLERMDQLSMGMSGDFLVAVEEGSTLVRIGRAIFGARPR